MFPCVYSKIQTKQKPQQRGLKGEGIWETKHFRSMPKSILVARGMMRLHFSWDMTLFQGNEVFLEQMFSATLWVFQ